MLLVYLFVCFVRVSFLSFFPSSWCRVLAAVCDCGTPWTFLLNFYQAKIGRKCCEHDSAFIFDSMFFKLAGKLDGYKIWDDIEFRFHVDSTDNFRIAYR